MTEGRSLDDLVRYVVESLVDDVEAIDIEKNESDSAVTYEIRVAPDDIGKVIGRQGRIIKAIRTVARAAGSTDDRSVEVEVLD